MKKICSRKRKSPFLRGFLQFIPTGETLDAYATFTKMITSVNKTSDSMNANPRISAT
jgi:hypothetical protein